MTVLSFILSLIETVRFLLKDKVKTLSSNMYAQTIRLKHRKHTKMFYKRQHSVDCFFKNILHFIIGYQCGPYIQCHAKRARAFRTSTCHHIAHYEYA